MIITITILLFSHIRDRHIEPNWTCSWALFTLVANRTVNAFAVHWTGRVKITTVPNQTEPNRTGIGRNHAFIYVQCAQNTWTSSVYCSTPGSGGDMVIAGGRIIEGQVLRAENRGPRARLWFLGRGQRAPSLPARCLGSAVSFPSGVWGGAPAEIKFGAF